MILFTLDVVIVSRSYVQHGTEECEGSVARETEFDEDQSHLFVISSKRIYSRFMCLGVLIALPTCM